MEGETELPWSWVPVHLGAITINLWMGYLIAIYGAIYRSLGIMNVPLFVVLISFWLLLFVILIFTLLYWSFYGDGVHIPS
ncbi:hypothetical protein J2741_001707 [Methanolinea mesophila]|uniref:hypothetical protein n=1 Tax=Methanolinea mesophila TaxID=547055 RepID=UPI001AE5108D|nr:hypothetical protein [Methanolinea mesophila]MBP1929160.1 hypothetical protein [Methanolinea mesophila]